MGRSVVRDREASHAYGAHHLRLAILLGGDVSSASTCGRLDWMGLVDGLVRGHTGSAGYEAALRCASVRGECDAQRSDRFMGSGRCLLGLGRRLARRLRLREGGALLFGMHLSP